jgi:hypothetical protein
MACDGTPAGTGDAGYTFSNLPWSSGLINRADRILVRNMAQTLTEPNTTITTYASSPSPIAIARAY